MAIDQLTKELDAQINKVYQEYVDLHAQLDQHRGQLIGDNNYEQVNKILTDIQLKFAELYPAFQFIAYKYQFATNATNSFSEFIESLQKAGAIDKDGKTIKEIH